MQSKIILITVSLLLFAGCSNNYKITSERTFVSQFKKDGRFVVSGTDATYMVASTCFYIVLQSGTKKDAIQYMSLKLSRNLQVGDNIWIYTNRYKKVKAANYYLK